MRQAFESIDNPSWDSDDVNFPIRARSERYEVLRKIGNPDEKII